MASRQRPPAAKCLFRASRFGAPRNQLTFGRTGHCQSSTTATALTAVRSLSSCGLRQAKGVFEGVTRSRIVTPWIDALENRRRDETEQGSGRGAQKQEKKERDMSPRKMSDSFHKEVLPLKEDRWLSDTYLNSSGHIRLGTIFMDLDAMAGIIAYKHTGEDVTVVTAACDRITIDNPLEEICDLEYSGQVTYASGRSSMEITCKVAKAPQQGQQARPEDTLLTCMFTMVALDPATKKAVNIRPLQVNTPAEEAIFKAGEARSIHKKTLKEMTLLQKPPNTEEAALIHSMWLRQLAYHDPANPLRLPANVYPMASTKLQTSAIMQPQHRNRHNFMIFGGYLMHQAFELAFCCCASFAHTRPAFISLDPSTFLNPVPVGSVLYLTATVVYTDPQLVDGSEFDAGAASSTGGGGGGAAEEDEKTRPRQSKQTKVLVRVDGKVREVEHGTAKPTGQFNFTFTVDRDVKVMPQTYQEYMVYVDAKRRGEIVEEEAAMGRGHEAGI